MNTEPPLTLACPSCDYDLSVRLTETCPECGCVFSEDEVHRWNQRLCAPHPKVDITGHGCCIMFCLLIAAACGLTAVGYGAPYLLVVALLPLAGVIALGLSLRRVVRRWRLAGMTDGIDHDG